MNYPNYVDAEMQELLGVLGTAIVPRSKRKAVVRTNRHVPYYTRGRYRRI